MMNQKYQCLYCNEEKEWSELPYCLRVEIERRIIRFHYCADCELKNPKPAIKADVVEHRSKGVGRVMRQII
jgi:NAD-dependent SIR2 family protein deacetylase